VNSRKDAWQRRGDLPHYVYRAYDEQNRVLYIGCTCDLRRRLKAHARTAAWYPLATRIEFTEYPNRFWGEWQERQAIATERPIYNRAHNDDRTQALWGVA
jgi:excinuclease UvrABC nuclease subunit